LNFFSSSSSDKYHHDNKTMNDPSPDLIKDVEIHQKLNEKQLSYDELFHRIDKNNDGKIEVNELIDLLENVGVETTSKQRADIAHVRSFSKLKSKRKIFCILISVLLTKVVDHHIHLHFHFNNLLIMF